MTSRLVGVTLYCSLCKIRPTLRPIATNVARSVVCLSVCLYMGHTDVLNGSRCRLGAEFYGHKNMY